MLVSGGSVLQGNKSKILELSCWVIKAIFLEGHFVAYIGPQKIFKKNDNLNRGTR